MARSATHIAVCCKLPHGLILRHPMDQQKTVTLNGKNKAAIIGAGYGTTMVDVDFWEQWVAVNQEFEPLKSKAIFTAENAADMEAQAKELAKEKTGFEGLDPNSHGVKVADKD